MRDRAVHIRPACRGDLPAVRGLLVETWHDTYDALIGAEKVTEITNAWHSIEALEPQLALPDASFLIAEADGGIVGHVFAHARTLPALVIARLYVRPGEQRRGIGSRLMAAVLARHPEASVIRLEVEAGNGKGLSFYRREGFEAVGERMEAGIPHIRMEKRLRPGG